MGTQVRLTAVLSGLEGIVDKWASANYGPGAVKVIRVIPSPEHISELKELLSTPSARTLVAFYEQANVGEEWMPGTPGDYLMENHTILCDVYRPAPINKTLGQYAEETDIWRDFREDLRAELAATANIRAGTGNAGIRVGPWTMPQIGFANRGAFCFFSQFSAEFLNQPRSL